MGTSGCSSFYVTLASYVNYYFFLEICNSFNGFVNMKSITICCFVQCLKNTIHNLLVNPSHGLCVTLFFGL